MLHNSEIVISDTSCLILLNKIGELDLLKAVSKRVFVTPEIQQEYREKLPPWITIKTPKNKSYQDLLETVLDKGEASAICLAKEIPYSILIIDDLKGRELAQNLGLRLSGTFGIIIQAKKIGVIPSVKPVLKKIRGTNFRFTERLFEIVMEEAEED